MQKEVVGLTPREKEVLGLLVQGYTNKKIALRLCISDFTVRDHVSSLLFKYGVQNRMRLMVVSGESEFESLCVLDPLQK